MNPAHIGTRRMTIGALKESEGLTGPAWLTRAEDTRPKKPEKFEFSVLEDTETVLEAIE